MNVASLEAARDKAREAVLNHPHQAQVEAARSRIVELKMQLKRQDLPTEKRSAFTKELSSLESTRKSLQSTQHAGLQAAQAALSAGRRAAQADVLAEAAAKLRDLPTAELEKRRHDITAKRKALKLELGPVVAVLGERQAEEAVDEKIANMSDAEKRVLFQRLQADGVASAEAVGVPGAI